MERNSQSLSNREKGERLKEMFETLNKSKKKLEKAQSTRKLSMEEYNELGNIEARLQKFYEKCKMFIKFRKNGPGKFMVEEYLKWCLNQDSYLSYSTNQSQMPTNNSTYEKINPQSEPYIPASESNFRILNDQQIHEGADLVQNECMTGNLSYGGMYNNRQLFFNQTFPDFNRKNSYPESRHQQDYINYQKMIPKKLNYADSDGHDKSPHISYHLSPKQIEVNQPLSNQFGNIEPLSQNDGRINKVLENSPNIRQNFTPQMSPRLGFSYSPENVYHSNPVKTIAKRGKYLQEKQKNEADVAKIDKAVYKTSFYQKNNNEFIQQSPTLSYTKPTNPMQSYINITNQYPSEAYHNESPGYNFNTVNNSNVLYAHQGQIQQQISPIGQEKIKSPKLQNQIYNGNIKSYQMLDEFQGSLSPSAYSNNNFKFNPNGSYSFQSHISAEHQDLNIGVYKNNVKPFILDNNNIQSNVKSSFPFQFVLNNDRHSNESLPISIDSTYNKIGIINPG